MQKKILPLIVAAAFTLAMSVPANAAPRHHFHHFHHHHHHAIKGHAANAGPWVVGSIVVSAASLITCAAIVNKKYNRELTQQEAFGAAGLPFSCLFWPPKEPAAVVVRTRG